MKVGEERRVSAIEFDNYYYIETPSGFCQIFSKFQWLIGTV